MLNILQIHIKYKYISIFIKDINHFFKNNINVPYQLIV